MKALIAAAALAASVASASAQQQCGPREGIAKYLASQFQEHPIGMGMNQEGRLVELFVSEEGSWTVVVTVPGVASCIVDGGDSWDAVVPGSDA